MDVNKIPLWRWQWYAFVAKDLISLIQDLRNDIAGKNGLISDLQHMTLKAEDEAQHWKERALKNEKASIEIERMRTTGIVPCILSNREFAASQRIRDLEDENESLRTRLKNVK